MGTHSISYAYPSYFASCSKEQPLSVCVLTLADIFVHPTVEVERGIYTIGAIGRQAVRAVRKGKGSQDSS